jgi:HEPN domain-containing protein
MKKKLSSLTKKIVAGYRADVIVLLETAAEEKGAKNHLDLAILKETPKPPPLRRAVVEALIADADIAIDVVVYTSDELRYLYSLGSPFIHRIMQEGRLLYMRKATMLWVADAVEELESAQVMYQHDRHKAACYHSLQAVEKGLHAIIMSKAKSPETTDDIVELYNRANALNFKTGLSVEDVVFVNSFSKHKYPVEEALLPHFRPNRDDAERAIDSARRLIDKLTTLKAK